MPADRCIQTQDRAAGSWGVLPALQASAGNLSARLRPVHSVIKKLSRLQSTL
jgi:hypothetical protein